LSIRLKKITARLLTLLNSCSFVRLIFNHLKKSKKPSFESHFYA
jgi:hypothetical protein